MNQAAPRILFVTTNFENGAIPNVLLDLAPLWRDEGWDCVFLALEPIPEDHASVHRCRSLGFPLHSLNVSPKSVVRALFRLRRAIRALTPSLISTHLGRADIYTPWVKGRVPMLTTHHSVKRNAGRLTLLGYQLSDSRVVLRTGVSQACNDSFLEGGFLRTAHRVIPNPVSPARLVPAVARAELRRRWGWGESDFVLAIVGRLIPVKDHATLLGVAAGLRKQGFPALRLVIAGDGPLRTPLEAQAQELGLDGSVRFLGAVENVADVYTAADALVMPSHWEGLGLVLLEAWTLGCPVAASSIPAVREFVVDGDNGVLFEPGNAAAMAAALGRLLEDPAAARQQARRGAELVRRRFSPQVVAAAYSQAFQAVLLGAQP